jgi:hypothetical protein
MRFKKLMAVFIAVSALTGCASGLNSIEKQEYRAFERDNVLVKEKDPTIAALLGILPGGGSFYVGEPGYGIANLFFWPLSVLWDPVSGYEGAKQINYDLTAHILEREKEKQIERLDDLLTIGQIDNKTYLLKKRKIEKEFDYN